MDSRRRAFTLVELLVVIGIIAIFVALLMPAITRAREQAQRLRCTSNLYSMGQALHLYVSRSGFYPQGDEFPPTGRYSIWVVRLWELLDRNGDLFFCPFRPDTYRPAEREWTATRDGEPLFTTFGGSRPFSYAYNVGGGDTTDFNRGIGGTWSRGTGGLYIPLRATRVRAPAEMIAIADGPDTKEPPFVTDCFDLSPQDGGVSLRIYAPKGAHRGKYMNVLFCDGHVEHLSRREVLSSRRRWNSDNQP